MSPEDCTPKIPDMRFAGCCEWHMFRDGFTDAFVKMLDVPPSAGHWKSALRDWRAGNTGWEAAHNAQRRAREAVTRANATPLVCIGGRNYALAGSDLAKRFGESKT